SKTASGYLAARRLGIGRLGRWRTGLTLTPRGEFSIVIAGLAVGAGVEAQLAPVATAYVLLTIIIGSVLARLPDTAWFRRAAAQKPPLTAPVQAVQTATSEPSA
ncbi:MAG: cation:proton antiporter, partial [Terrimesophilobacter sp.]